MINKIYKILLIEDDEVDAKLIDRILKRKAPDHVEIKHITCFSDAKTTLDNDLYDVILLDLHLPDSAGKETVKLLLTHPRAIPIIVLSGHTSDDVAKKAVRDGAQDYITKREITNTNILQKINNAIEQHGLMQAPVKV